MTQAVYQIDLSGRHVRVEDPVGDGSSDLACPYPGYPTWLDETLKGMWPFADLPDNWDSYGGVAPSREFLFQTLGMLKDTEEVNLPVPQTVPLSDGGVQLEWCGSDYDIEIAFSPLEGISILVTDSGGDVVLEEEGVMSENVAVLRGAFEYVRKS
jgi:hypothetical protein